MSNFFEEFMQNYGDETSNQLSENLGVDKKSASQIIPQVLPLLLGGLRKQKDEMGGEERVDHILNKYGSTNVLDNLGGLFKSKANDSNADPQLGGLLGQSGLQATNMIADKFNIDSNTAMKIIPMLAPVVLGALSKKRDTQGAGATGIAALLDQDGDGNILDDVSGFLTKGLGSGKAGGNVLGNVLGGLFGKKK